jgi:DNA/RNA-binding domain of Phe-tRNA-synthetase-like protein
MKINISEKISQLLPDLKIAVMNCEVKNSPTTDELWTELENECVKIKNTFLLEEINQRPAIFATRQAYKRLGKDPNRYRPSAEALCRRIIREIPIYRLSTLVDIINIVSIRSGFSIGGFDLNKIEGEVELGIGTSEDVFDAIGRGLLNVEELPLYRDEQGGIGTPTSDNERTKITDNTTKVLLIFNAYNGLNGLEDAVSHCKTLLEKYANGKNFRLEII